MIITEQTSTVNTTAKKNRKIEYIVVHYTAGTTSKAGTAKSTAKYFAKDTTKASADFIIDDATVVKFNTDIRNRYTWHCGGSKYKTKGGTLYKVCTNANSIGIEVCSSNKTKKVTNANDENWYFTDAVVSNCAELVRSLMSEYNIDADHVIRHYDVNGKPCPGIVGWNIDTGDDSKWLEFKKCIAKTAEAIPEEESPIETAGDVLSECEEKTSHAEENTTVEIAADVMPAVEEQPADTALNEKNLKKRSEARAK